MNYRRILIILFGAIGDVTQALPLAVRLKHSSPECHITWAIEPRSASMLAGHPAIDRVIVFERGGGLQAYRRFVQAMRAEEYDLALDLQRHFKSGVTSFLSRAPVRLGFHWQNAKEMNWIFNNRHVEWAPDLSPKIKHYQKFGDWLGLAPLEPLEFGLSASVEEREKVAALLENEATRNQIKLPAEFAAVICGASFETKRWPVRHYRELIARLWREQKLCCILVGGPDEAGFATAVTSEGCPLFDLIGKTSLRELGAVFERCRLVIGPDTGPSHIAAAYGKPVISLWGPTPLIRSAPYRSESFALQSAVGCSPCRRRVCPGLDTICMSDIVPEAVLARVGEVAAHGS